MVYVNTLHPSKLETKKTRMFNDEAFASHLCIQAARKKQDDLRVYDYKWNKFIIALYGLFGNQLSFRTYGKDKKANTTHIH
jgi:hypothetical protein